MSPDSADYLIQGYYFQRREGVGLATVPIEGTVAIVREQLVAEMFAGGFHRNESGRWSGWMNEPQGPSWLSDFVLTEQKFFFSKAYEDGRSEIAYEFVKKDDMWVGHWVASDNRGWRAEGDANCILTPVSDTFFVPSP